MKIKIKNKEIKNKYILKNIQNNAFSTFAKVVSKNPALAKTAVQGGTLLGLAAGVGYSMNQANQTAQHVKQTAQITERIVDKGVIISKNFKEGMQNHKDSVQIMKEAMDTAGNKAETVSQNFKEGALRFKEGTQNHKDSVQKAKEFVDGLGNSEMVVTNKTTTLYDFEILKNETRMKILTKDDHDCLIEAINKSNQEKGDTEPLITWIRNEKERIAEVVDSKLDSGITEEEVLNTGLSPEDTYPNTDNATVERQPNTDNATVDEKIQQLSDSNPIGNEGNLIHDSGQIFVEPATTDHCCVIFTPFEELVPILTVEQKGLLFITILILFALAFYKNKNIIINRWLDGQKKYEKVIGAVNFLFLPLYFELLEKQPSDINQDLLQFYSVFPVLIWLVEPLWGINNKPEKTEVFSKIKVYIKVSCCIIVYFCMWFARLFG